MKYKIIFFFLFFSLTIVNLTFSQGLRDYFSGWELGSSVGFALGYSETASPEETGYSIPCEIFSTYKAGQITWFMGFEVGVGIKFISQNPAALDFHIVAGATVAFRRFISFWIWQDILSNDPNYFKANFEGRLLLFKNYFKINDTMGFFVDVNFFGQTILNNANYNRDFILGGINICLTFTNESRAGILGGGLLFFLSPQFWLDPGAYSSQTITGG